MSAAMGYMLRYYWRSYRFVAPLVLYVGTVFFVYSIVPNPVLSSYGFTSTVLCLVSAWLTFTYIDVEDAAQQIVTALHLGGTGKYYAAKLLLLAFIGATLSIGATAYPILFRKFAEEPTVEQSAIGLLSHVLLSVLGIAIGAMFTSKFVRKLNVAILGLLLALALATAGQGLANALPDKLSFVAWLIPPLFRVMEKLNGDTPISLADISGAFAGTLTYAAALFGVFWIGAKKRLF